jgi:broad specificity phosphatase PhoE
VCSSDLDQVAGRARAVIARAEAANGDVALFGHAHCLRILTACWLGLPPVCGRLFALATASVSVLGYEHRGRAMVRWNISVPLLETGCPPTSASA